MGDNTDYKKYDKGGVSPAAPTTKPRTMPGTHGTPKGALTKALNRKKEQAAMLKKMEEDY